MENQINKAENLQSDDKTSTPGKLSINTDTAASTSKVFIITPEQIAKLGLTQQLQKAVQSQVSLKTQEKETIKMIKQDLTKTQTDQISSQKLDDIKEETPCFKQPNPVVSSIKVKLNQKLTNVSIKGSSTIKDPINVINIKLEDSHSQQKAREVSKKNDTKKDFAFDIGTIKTEDNKEEIRDIITKEHKKIILKPESTNTESIKNKNNSENVKVINTIKTVNDKRIEVPKNEVPKPSEIVNVTNKTDETKKPQIPNIPKENDMILSMKNKLSNLLETRGSLTEKSIPHTSKCNLDSTDNNTKTTVKKATPTQKRKQNNELLPSPPPVKQSKTTTSPSEVTSHSESKITKTEATSEHCYSQSTPPSSAEPVKAKIDTSESNVFSESSTSTTSKDELPEIKEKKVPLRKGKLKPSPNISKITKISRKSNINKVSDLSTSENENIDKILNSEILPTTGSLDNVTKEIPELKKLAKPQKIHVLSNEQISLPQTYIDHMLKQNCCEPNSQKLQLCKPTSKIISNTTSKEELKFDANSSEKIESKQEMECEAGSVMEEQNSSLSTASSESETSFVPDKNPVHNKTDIEDTKLNISESSDHSSKQLDDQHHDSVIENSSLNEQSLEDSVLKQKSELVSATSMESTTNKELERKEFCDAKNKSKIFPEDISKLDEGLNSDSTQLHEMENNCLEDTEDKKNKAETTEDKKDKAEDIKMNFTEDAKSESKLHAEVKISPSCKKKPNSSNIKLKKLVDSSPNIKEHSSISRKRSASEDSQKIKLPVKDNVKALRNKNEEADTSESDIMKTIISVRGSVSDITVTKLPQISPKMNQPTETQDDVKISAIKEKIPSKPSKTKNVAKNKNKSVSKQTKQMADNFETAKTLEHNTVLATEKQLAEQQEVHEVSEFATKISTTEITSKLSDVSCKTSSQPVLSTVKTPTRKTKRPSLSTSTSSKSEETVSTSSTSIQNSNNSSSTKLAKETPSSEVEKPTLANSPHKRTILTTEQSPEAKNATGISLKDINSLVIDPVLTKQPKKRGRKRKSETPIKEEEKESEFEMQAKMETSASGRKRKFVNYAAMLENNKNLPEKNKKPKAVRSPVTKPLKAANNSSNELFEINAAISHNADDNAASCTYSVEKVSSQSDNPETEQPNKDNEPFLQVDVTEKKKNKETEVDSSSSSTSGLKVTLIEIPADDPNQIQNSKPKVSQKMPREGPKRKRGRPRAHYTENSLTNKVMNSIFNVINTSAQSTEEADSFNVSTNSSISSDINNSSEGESERKWISVKTHGLFDDSQPKESGSTVTCAVCAKEIEKPVWPYHKIRHHNNLAWKVGEPPLDLNDQKLVMSILTDLYKRKKPLFCENCGQSKKSVMGFLSHKTVCQKSTEEVTAMKLKCEFCDRSVMPVSMAAHLKFCKGLHPHQAQKVVYACPKPVEEEQELPGTSKRKAAAKAEKLLKEFKDDGTLGPVKEDKLKSSRMWHTDFDFHPTFFGKKRFQYEIALRGVAKCRFKECSFESSDADEILNHLYTCDKKTAEGYTCKFCILTYTTEDEILEHVQEVHSKYINAEPLPVDETGEEEGLDKDESILAEDCDIKLKNKIMPKLNLMHGIKFLLESRYCAPTTGVAYPAAMEWALKFCMRHFSIPNLFPHWIMNAINFEKLDPKMFIKYLPSIRYSASTARIETKRFVDPLKLDYDWKRYKLFEAEMLHNGTSIMFCGGSIFAMAWAPTPYDQQNCEQILAVSTNNDIDKGYTLDEVYHEPGLIQFWNCGVLLNNTVATDKPKLQFCIAHDYGPAWCLEWCPSGCYDLDVNNKLDNLRRLGILAVGCADSYIYVYSVCFPDPISGKIFKPQPVLKLVLDSVLEEPVSGIEAHVTKLSWSKAAGHQFLAAGYANGIVAVYDLGTTSTLLNAGLDKDDINMIMPYRIINAHYHAITALSMYHLNDGRRWLMSGSTDRNIKYWDLESPVVPITNFTKLIVTDGTWLNHWLSTVQTFDDSCGGGLTYTAAHQLRNFESEAASIMHSNSRVNTITGSEWANGFVQGNIVGEIKGFFPHQMFYCMDGDKSFRQKKVILGYARLVEKNVSIQDRLNEEQQKLNKVNSKPTQLVDNERMMEIKNLRVNTDHVKSEPITYKEAEKKYGLVFCDMRVNNVKEFAANIDSYFKSNNSNKLYASRPNVYPMQSINKTVLNPNRRSFLYLATGYHAGFVRISCLQFLNNDNHMSWT